jgi:DNA-binding GntR family transcriptional regulator
MADDKTQRRGSGDPTQRILQAILEGQFNPNERLVEEDLVRQFGGTRAAVRQTLAVLEQQGLVTKERNRGARVRLISASEAIEIMEIRSLVEALIARHAARLITPKGVKALHAMTAHLESLSAKRDFVGYSQLNVEFHAEIARIAQNHSAERILSGLRSQTIAFQFRPILEPGRAAEIDAEHRVLVAALAAADEVAAEAAMRSHIDNAARALRAAIVGREMVQRSMMSVDA